MIDRKTALDLLHKNVQNQNLRRHHYAVEACMRALARKLKVKSLKLKIDEEAWGIVGLIHDADYEQTKENPSQHTKIAAEWLRQAGANDEVIRAVLTHNYAHTGENPPSNDLEWSLYCCDELTGLIVATALVRPDKKISTVSVESVLKKFLEKSFAAGVNRDQIKMCEEKLGIPLPEFVGVCLSAMQSIASELSL